MLLSHRRPGPFAILDSPVQVCFANSSAMDLAGTRKRLRRLEHTSPVESGLMSQDKESVDGCGHLPHRCLRFGEFELDLTQQRLFRNGSRIKLVGKPYEMLIVLLENPGTTVTREALRMRLWPKGGPVDHYSNVSTIVCKLRRVLGETEREPSIIATIPGRGYSFIAKIEYQDQPMVGIAPPCVQEADRETSPLPRQSDPWPWGWKPGGVGFTAGVVALFIVAVLLGVAITLYTR